MVRPPRQAYGFNSGGLVLRKKFLKINIDQRGGNGLFPESMDYPSLPSWPLALIITAGGLSAAVAQATEADLPSAELDLPGLTVIEPTIGEPTPVTSFAMPVSLLRYEPRVDIQRRGAAETQSDVTVRGSTFEAIGFSVGAAPLFDPQTGHYFAEIPVSPQMLTGPHLYTGSANAWHGFNATTATIGYGWRPVEQRGRVEGLLGTNETYGGILYQGLVFPEESILAGWAIDGEIALIESDGARPRGDSSLERYTIRAQHRSALGQTDLFGGYQAKFFGWPNLYTPFSPRESENLQTTFVTLNHRLERDGDGFAEGALSFRRNKDEYQFNRDNPTNLFQHETRFASVSVIGREETDRYFVNYRALGAYDEITSNSLRFGRFNSRTYGKIGAVPGIIREAGDADRWFFGAGGFFEGSDRDGGRFSPQTRLAYEQNLPERRYTYYTEYSEASRFPAYTTLNSARAGLFGGNPDLGRELARQVEVGLTAESPRVAWQTALFYREDRDLADWVFSPGALNARRAVPVAIDTIGWETFLTLPFEGGRLTVGYTFLSKDESYGEENVLGSFYALNYPEHRATVGGDWRPFGGLLLRGDLEYRRQQENALRNDGGRDAFLAVLGANASVPHIDGLEVAITVENVFNTHFQEVPGTPGIPRQVLLSVAYHW